MNVALDKVAKRRGTPLPDGTYVVDHYHAPNQPMLDDMAEAALSVLAKNRKGFVLLVEGAHIDKQSHLMDADRAMGEVLEFDRAVGVARRFAEAPEGTVVVVLADHECSGFSLIGALTGGVAAARSLPSDAAALDPAAMPARQKVAGTYDAAGFPRYAIQADGYPATMDVDGKMLVGYGASGDRYETWLSKPLPVIDGLLPDDVKGELKAQLRRRARPARLRRLRLLPARPRARRTGGPHRRRRPHLRLQLRQRRLARIRGRPDQHRRLLQAHARRAGPLERRQCSPRANPGSLNPSVVLGALILAGALLPAAGRAGEECRPHPVSPAGAHGDDVVLSFATVGDSREEAGAAYLTPQDKIWLQNTKAWSRIMRSVEEQKSKLLVFNGDMIMGYGLAVPIRATVPTS